MAAGRGYTSEDLTPPEARQRSDSAVSVLKALPEARPSPTRWPSGLCRSQQRRLSTQKRVWNRKELSTLPFSVWTHPP